MNLPIKILIVVGVTSTHLSPWSRLSGPWPTGTTAMWAAALLLAYLFLSYESARTAGLDDRSEESPDQRRERHGARAPECDA